MNTYIVDFENTHSQGLVGINKLSEEDRVYIFYTEPSNSITIDLHKEIITSKAQIIFKKVCHGVPNALDFQLSSFLGYLLSEKSEDRYIIVSKDKGYTPVVKFWENDFKIILVSSILEVFETKTMKPVLEVKNIKKDKQVTNNVELVTVEQVKPLVRKNIDATKVTEIINHYKTKTAVNNNLVKLYKSEQAGIIYKAIKPLLKNKK